MTKRTPVRDERGQILIITAVTLTVILGIAALSVDASFMYDKRNRLYAAADAAAKGAALELARGNSVQANLEAFAKREVTNHGFNPGGSTVVEVFCPPVDGNFTGGSCATAGYVEVRLSESTSTFFGGVLGISSLTPGAWAVAGVVPSSTCMLALSPTGTGVTATGASVVNAASCGIAVNSTGPSNALLASPGSANVTVQSIDVTGPASSVNKGGGVISLCCPDPPNVNVPSLSDPLSSLPAPTALSCTTGTPVCGSPTQGGCVHTSQVVLSGVTTTLNPGTFCGGIDLLGGGSGFYTLNPGIYILQGGGLTVRTAAHLTGSNVLIYNTGDAGHPIQPIDFKGGPTITSLSGYTVAPYNGIAIFEDRTLPGGGFISESDAQVAIDGALYFPNSTISFQNNTTVAQTLSLLIGKSLSFTNSAVVVLSPSGTLPSAIKSATLAQ